MREPDIIGKAAKAWKMSTTGTSTKPHSTVSFYLVEGINPQQFHPFWNRWVMNMIHLRDVPGLPPAELEKDTNTHEFMIMSLEPEKPINIDDVTSIPFMSPLDAVVQFECDSDDQAAEVLEQAVRCVCDGFASPDSDFRQWWKDAIPNTVEHARFGGHSMPDKILQ